MPSTGAPTIALTNTERLIRLINDILDISEIEAGRLILKKAIVPPAELVHQSIAAVQTPPGVTVTATLADPIPDVYVDPDRMLQALLNLLSNAAKFAPAGTAVEVAVTRDGDRFVRCSVTDHGDGIPPEQMNRLFRRFQQLDASTTRLVPGTGLGLAITKALVEGRGGQIDVTSTEGKGSTFSFTAPVAVPVLSVQP